MMLILHDNSYYESRKPEEDLGACKNCLRFIWNKEKKSFLDRSANEWASVGLFYICFFGVLFSIFALQLWITVYYISRLDKPYFELNKQISSKTREGRSTIDRKPLFSESPGISFHPNIFSPTTSPLIWINDLRTQSRFERYIQSLNDTFQEYLKGDSDYNPGCIEGQVRDYRTISVSCFFDIKRLGVCGSPPYGYTRPVKPCVIIKINKRFNWVPDCFNQTSVLPENMPEWLKSVIRSSTQSNVWLSCDGVNNVDKELVGHIDYFPISGFPALYFPFNGRGDYLAPLVALYFTNLTVDRLITVECTIWAENIEHKRSLDFQLMFNAL